METERGAKEIRTPDLCSAIAALYQLSYSPASYTAQKYGIAEKKKSSSRHESCSRSSGYRLLSAVRSDGSRRGLRRRSHRVSLGAADAHLGVVLD